MWDHRWTTSTAGASWPPSIKLRSAHFFTISSTFSFNSSTQILNKDSGFANFASFEQQCLMKWWRSFRCRMIKLCNSAQGWSQSNIRASSLTVVHVRRKCRKGVAFGRKLAWAKRSTHFLSYDRGCRYVGHAFALLQLEGVDNQSKWLRQGSLTCLGLGLLSVHAMQVRAAGVFMLCMPGSANLVFCMSFCAAEYYLLEIRRCTILTADVMFCHSSDCKHCPKIVHHRGAASTDWSELGGATSLTGLQSPRGRRPEIHIDSR